MHVLAYLRGTPDYSITYHRRTAGTRTSITPVGYIDADYGGRHETRCSTSGYDVMMATGPVSWSFER